MDLHTQVSHCSQRLTPSFKTAAGMANPPGFGRVLYTKEAKEEKKRRNGNFGVLEEKRRTVYAMRSWTLSGDWGLRDTSLYIS